MQQSGEPSVEDILATIRKVVAGDDSSAARAGTFAGDERQSRGDGDDVLELTDVVEHDGANPPADDEGAPLMAEAPAAAIRDSLAVLPLLGEPAAAAQIVRSAEAAVERVAGELLRPMLAAWLDTNLPPLVEKLVAAEIARIAATRR